MILSTRPKINILEILSHKFMETYSVSSRFYFREVYVCDAASFITFGLFTLTEILELFVLQSWTKLLIIIDLYD